MLSPQRLWSSSLVPSLVDVEVGGDDKEWQYLRSRRRRQGNDEILDRDFNSGTLLNAGSIQTSMEIDELEAPNFAQSEKELGMGDFEDARNIC
jgi:hypothetical protein